MLVTTTDPISSGTGGSRTPSILDSPTLARVERARLRLEAASSNQQLNQLQQNQLNHNNTFRDGSLERSLIDSKREIPWHQVWTHMKRLSNNSKVNSTNTLTTTTPKTHCSTPAKKCSMIPDSRTTSISGGGSIFRQQVFYQPEMQSLLAGRIPVGSMTGPIKRGLLWQQRDRIFSRWKERYFVLTRDYLHCFKRASGSANERASDMGQFIFKVKLVDVEKVEWLNRRSYSAIGLLLGREGRVLLRCDDGLEDWFELLEECTQTSKERRRALKITQGPRSRASLAAPVSHASLQAHHFGLGGTYSSALDDWLMANVGTGIGGRHKIGSGSIGGIGGAGGIGGGTNPFLFSDSVPDLSTLNNENHHNHLLHHPHNHHHHHHHHNGISTNHSTPQKIPYSSSIGHNFNWNRNSNGHHHHSITSQNGSAFSNNGSCLLYGSPRRIFINSSFGSNQIVDEEAEDTEVQMRRPKGSGGGGGRAFRNSSYSNNNNPENGNNNESDRDCLYRKPRAPTDAARHSIQTTDLDYTINNDSGLDTPPSTHRPSSYRDPSHASPRDSTETTVSSSRGTLLLNSPGGSFRSKQHQQQQQQQQHLNHITNLNQVNALNGSRYSVQERILKIRNEDDHRCSSIKSANHRFNQNNTNETKSTGMYDPNQNRYYKQQQQQHHHNYHHPALPPPATTTTTLTPQRSPGALSNNGNNGNFSGNLNGSAIFRERYQHPALAAIINESQGLKFRDRSYSDCQKGPPRRSVNNNPSPTPRRIPIFGTPTRV